MKRIVTIAVAVLLVTGSLTQVEATVITSILGNSSPGFSDGDAPSIFQIGAAQAGQPSPFDMAYGNDVLTGQNFSKSWEHLFGAIFETITSATITIGIADHDSAASGSQVASFDVEGAPLTPDLDALFEASGGSGEGVYNVYTLSLPASAFPSIADGSAVASLSLQHPGLVIPLFPLPGPNPPQESVSNGAYLIFSELQITTQAIPEPSTMLLLGVGLIGLCARARRLSRR